MCVNHVVANTVFILFLLFLWHTKNRIDPHSDKILKLNGPRTGLLWIRFE